MYLVLKAIHYYYLSKALWLLQKYILEPFLLLSTERLPTLTREEEERIIRLKKFVLQLLLFLCNWCVASGQVRLSGRAWKLFPTARYEDDTEKANEKKAAQFRIKVNQLVDPELSYDLHLLASFAIDDQFSLQERGRLRRQQSFQNGHVTIYEADRFRNCFVLINMSSTSSSACAAVPRQCRRRWK